MINSFFFLPFFPSFFLFNKTYIHSFNRPESPCVDTVVRKQETFLTDANPASTIRGCGWRFLNTPRNRAPRSQMKMHGAFQGSHRAGAETTGGLNAPGCSARTRTHAPTHARKRPPAPSAATATSRHAWVCLLSGLADQGELTSFQLIFTFGQMSKEEEGGGGGGGDGGGGVQKT